MSTPYIGEIRMFAGTFAPLGWAFCDGQLVAISENDALFALIGTTYGGDGQTTFALPNLQGRIPIHQGQSPGLSLRVIGTAFGTETVTLTKTQMPSHQHPLAASGAANLGDPGGHLVGNTGTQLLYVDTDPDLTMSPDALVPRGGGQPHSNLMPYLCVNFIISLFGIFPSQT
jgi:microcystin-dependent protein